jgi:hypothetical protein
MGNVTLTIGRPQAAGLLLHQLSEGQRLLVAPLEDRVGLAQVNQVKSAWSLRNRQLLFRVFEDNSGIAGYKGMSPLSPRASLGIQIEHFRQEVRAQLACLQAVLDRVS